MDQMKERISLVERCEQDNWRALVPAGLVAAALIYLSPLLLSTPLLEPDEGLLAGRLLRVGNFGGVMARI